MDESKKYIEMCEKAVEVQKLFKRRDGDYYTYRNVYADLAGVKVIVGHGSIASGYKIWVPRPDQLREMAFETKNPVYITKTLYNFIHNNSEYVSGLVETFEQLLLVYLMKEKYQMLFNEEKNDWEQIVTVRKSDEEEKET